MIRGILIGILLLFSMECFCWGFYAHRQINYMAVFLLPPQMMPMFKKNINFLSEHSVDPDKRRYAVPEEGPRHYLDIDRYGTYPYNELPRNYDSAVAKFGIDTIMAHGTVPWHVQVMQRRLTAAFRDRNFSRILKTSAELGHYISDAHVPLHASSNHNGQYTNQKGIHGFWESRVPELLAEKEFDFIIGKAVYIEDPGKYIWDRFLESAVAADSVLTMEKELTAEFPADQKFAFEERNGVVIRQYSKAFTIAFNKKLDGMIERRMRQAIHTISSFWYTAWVNAGQPDLKQLNNEKFSEAELKEFEELNLKWNSGGKMLGRDEE